MHDDHVVADSLVAKLDELEWHIRFESVIIPAKDPLAEMSRASAGSRLDPSEYRHDENGNRYY